MKKRVEIAYSLAAKLSTEDYSNLNPLYHHKIVFHLEEGETIDTDVEYEKIRLQLHGYINLEKERINAAKVRKSQKNMKIQEIDGKQFVSVTTAIGWDKDFNFLKAGELEQYGARGTILHKLFQEYVKTGVVELQEKYPELAEAIVLIKKGSLQMDLSGFNYQGFWEKHGGDIEIKDTERDIINREHLYTGRVDWVGNFRGDSSVLDIKTGEIDKISCFKQMAAYAHGDGIKGIKKLVIISITDKIKAGFRAPIETDKIEHYYNLFLKDRDSFKRVYGI